MLASLKPSPTVSAEDGTCRERRHREMVAAAAGSGVRCVEEKKGLLKTNIAQAQH